MSRYHESDFEEAVIDCLRQIGWDYAFGPDIERNGDYTNPRLDDRLEAALRRINRKAAPAAVREALRSAFCRAAVPRAVAEPLDWLENAVPSHWRLADGDAVYDWTPPGERNGEKKKILKGE